jgi:hypothetical protein
VLLEIKTCLDITTYALQIHSYEYGNKCVIQVSCMDLRKLDGDEAVNLILDVLKKADEPLTTREIQLETEKRRVQCPDSTIVFLNRLRLKGIVHGQMSKERRGWIWWIDN